MAVIYTGHETMTYSGYLDAATGKTLTCEPGGTYEVIAVSISEGAFPNDGRFAPAEDDPAGDEPAGSPEAGPAPEAQA